MLYWFLFDVSWDCFYTDHMYHIAFLAKCFTFIGSTTCSKYLCFKFRIKKLWRNVFCKVWRFNHWKWKIISFIIKLNINFSMFIFDSQINKRPLIITYILLFELTVRRANLFTISFKFNPVINGYKVIYKTKYSKSLS